MSYVLESEKTRRGVKKAIIIALPSVVAWCLCNPKYNVLSAGGSSALWVMLTLGISGVAQ